MQELITVEMELRAILRVSKTFGWTKEILEEELERFANRCADEAVRIEKDMILQVGEV